eukprot:TRINITY_DN7611_c0_g1_i1.p1 TRINITY_DN7611_c0_g1~~TRINITY_DN7611_c0_g1_i1.p1  ORF type:complete len:593 (+),score=211.90 TRINITY_DN7611_c0_g1_i1:74-1780(+)
MASAAAPQAQQPLQPPPLAAAAPPQQQGGPPEPTPSAAVPRPTGRRALRPLDPTALYRGDCRSAGGEHDGATPQQPPCTCGGATRAQRHLGSFEALLENPFLSDVTLRVGKPPEGVEDCVIPAHRCVLAAHSATFRAMFESGWREAGEATALMDYPYDACKCVLRHIYCCEAPITPEIALDVLDAAVFYDLAGLRDEAVRFLKDTTTKETVFEHLRCGVLYDDAGLREHCIAFVRQSNAMSDILFSQVLFDIPGPVLMLLVEEAVIESDLVILKRMHAWCVEQERRDRTGEIRAANLLQGFLRYISFTDMNAAELDEIEQKGLVSIEEVLYPAFKKKLLGIADEQQVPRRGVIHLQWDDAACTDGISLEGDNHIRKGCGDGWECVVALNKFSRGKHYWTYTIHELQQPHDCLVGVCQHRMPNRVDPRRAEDSSVIFFEPCCNTVRALGVTEKKGELPDLAASGTDWLEIGILVDFDHDEISFFNHTTKEQLWLVRCSPLPTPLYPYAAIHWLRNGGITLSETTTYPHRASERRPLPRSPLRHRSPLKGPPRAKHSPGLPGGAAAASAG